MNILKSTSSSEYLSDFLARNVSTLMHIIEILDTVHITKYEYNQFGREYICVRIEFVLNEGSKLTDTQYKKSLSNYSALEVYVGRTTHLPTHLAENEQSIARTDVNNVLNFFTSLVKNVSFESPKSHNTLKTLTISKGMRPFMDY